MFDFIRMFLGNRLKCNYKITCLYIILVNDKTCYSRRCTEYIKTIKILEVITMKEKDIFKEFEEEYGINLLLPQEEQAQEPQQQTTENLFSKLHRFKNRKFKCDLDITEYKRWRLVDKTISIMLMSMLVMVVMTIISNCHMGGTTRCNLVSSPGATEPAFLGYKFTDELISEIENGNIDLYEVYIVEDTNDNNDLQGVRIENKYGFPVNEICIIDANYIEYSDEYIRTMFSPEYIKEHDDNWGYWEYTLDCQ